MPTFNEAYLRHQQSRWLRPDAVRWIRPDAARFLQPDTCLEDAFPALALKYNPSQPRVLAGNGIESGRWTDGDGGGSALPRPMGDVAIGEIHTDETEDCSVSAPTIKESAGIA